MRIWCISIIALVLPMGAMGLSSTSTSTSPCGEPDDSCMDNENWKQCRNLELNGCQHIEILESCPLQFTCRDVDDVDDEELQQSSEVSTIDDILPFVIPAAPFPTRRDQIVLAEDETTNNGDPDADACVSLFVYQNGKCHGQPLRTMSFPTWTERGSPCVHDARQHYRSAKDQYCNLSTGNWHETVIVGSSTCHPPHWWEGGKKYDLTFTTDSCIGGVSLKSCTQGPCGDDSHEMDRP